MAGERRSNYRNNTRDQRPDNRTHDTSRQHRPPRGRDNDVWYDAQCTQCGESFKVPFEPDPNRPILCKSCLRASRDSRHEGDEHRAPFEEEPREPELYEITCTHCGKHDTVPFKPYEGSVVLCKDCMNNPNVERVGGKIYHTIICSVCGKENKVPFKPDPGSRVLCRECHAKEREAKQQSRAYFSRHHPAVVHNVRTSIEIRCEKCGNFDTLPFVPKTNGPILCRQCAENTFGEEWARRNRVGAQEYPFTCARCAAQDFVPFKPKPDQELLCRHCLNDQAILNHKRSEMTRHDAFTCVRKNTKKED